MIKIVYCLRRRPDLSLEDFSHYWREVHAPLVREHAAALGIRRYVQSHRLDDPRLAPPLDARGCEGEPYDGVAELWWEDVAAVEAAGATREGRAAGRALLADEREFVDLSSSRIFFSEEFEVP